MGTIKQEIKTWNLTVDKNLNSYLKTLIDDNGYTIVQVIPTHFVNGPYISGNTVDITSATIIVLKTDNNV